MADTPPLRIDTDRLVLRCWTRADAPLLKLAVDASLDHLRRWMTWAWDEPSKLEVVEHRLERKEAQFLAGEDFTFGLFDRGESEVVGAAGLHRRIGPGALEMGYWIRADRAGRGLATEAARALTKAGLALPDIDRVQIRCDPANAASASIPRKLGYRQCETLIGNELTPDGRRRDTLVFEMTAEEYEAGELRLEGDRDVAHRDA